MPHPVPALDRPRSVAALRSLLADSGYDAPGVQAMFGTAGRALVSLRELPVHERRLPAEETPLSLLLRLFLLDLPVDAGHAESVLGTEALGHLVALRAVAEEQAGTLRACLRIVPHELLLIASDVSRADTGSAHVAGVHPPSATLAGLTVRRSVARALDMGTGNGIQALLLAGHAEAVVATDVNERALAFAELNARLNGVGNIEWRHGSFFEPVADERFDLVVSNPPYVISPESEYVFRDSGLGRDRVSAQVTRALPSVLAEGGFATLMVSWIAEPGGELAEQPRGWLEGSGCDAWLLRTAAEDPLSTAATWNRDAPSPEALRERVDRWLEYYRREGIELIAYGTLVLRHSGGGWLRELELPQGERRAASDQLKRMFAAVDLLERTSDEALLDAVVRPVPDARLEHVNVPHEQDWRTIEVELVLAEGLSLRAALDAPAAAVVRRLASGRPLREVLAEASAQQDVPAEEFTAGALSLVRRMLELGFTAVDDG